MSREYRKEFLFIHGLIDFHVNFVNPSQICKKEIKLSLIPIDLAWFIIKSKSLNKIFI